MKLISFKWQKIEIPTLRALPLRAQKANVRELAIVTFIDEQDRQHHLELAPLTALGQPTLEDCLDEIQQFLNSVLPFEINPSNFQIDQYLFGVFKNKLSVAVQYALESFFLNFISSPKLSPVLSNDLLLPDQLGTYRNTSHCYKIKWRPSDDIQKLVEFLNSNPLSTLRLDANQSLTPDQLDSLCQQINLKQVEYFEEPLQDIQQWNVLDERPPLALDENLLDCLENNPASTVAWVIKPLLLGLSSTIKIIRQAGKQNKKAVISSCFEGSLGMRSLIQLINIPEFNELLNWHHGLGTYRFLQEENPLAGISYANNFIIVE